MTAETPASKCPACGHPLTRATGIDGGEQAPDPGDYSVCLYCGQLLRFDEDLAVRPATLDEAGDELDEWALGMLLRARCMILQRAGAN